MVGLWDDVATLWDDTDDDWDETPVTDSDITAAVVDLTALGAPIIDLSLTTSDRQWQESLSEAGSASVVVQNDDAALAEFIMPNRLINFWLFGVPVFTMVLESRKSTLVSQDEESKEVTLWQGRGHTALLDRGTIFPSIGVGRRPIEEDRAFNWTASSYDDSEWIAATTVTDVGTAQGGGWDGGGAEYQFDPDFPDATAEVLWASDGTTSDAGIGDCYFRDATVTIPSDGTYTLFVVIDNYGEVYVDGQLIMSPGQSDTLEVGFTGMSRFALEMTAGSHLIAIKGTNGPGASPNPAGIAAALYETNALGAVISLIWHSDNASMKIVEYATEPPGMTPGKAMLIVLEEAWARGALTYVIPTFDEAVDSDGNDWPIIADMATKVGTSVLQFFRELSGTYIDFRMRPHTLYLDAWNFGDQGSTVAVDLHSPTDENDPESGNLTEHHETSEIQKMNVGLIRYSGGWAERLDNAAVAADGRIEALLGLGALGSLAEAYRVTDGQLAEFKDERVQTDVGTASVDATDAPYLAYNVGDTITVESVAHRVLALTVTEDNDNGRAIVVPTLNDAVVLDPLERLAQAISKMIPGTLGGRSKVAQPVVPTAIPRSLAPAESVSELAENAVAGTNASNSTTTLWTSNNGAIGLADVVGNTTSLVRPDVSLLPAGRTYWTRLWTRVRAGAASTSDMRAAASVAAVGTIGATDVADVFASNSWGLYVRMNRGESAGPPNSVTEDVYDLGNNATSGWFVWFTNGSGSAVVELYVMLSAAAQYGGGSSRFFEFNFVDDAALAGPLLVDDEMSLEVTGTGAATVLVAKLNGVTVLTSDIPTFIASESIADPDRDLPNDGLQGGFDVQARDTDKTGFGRMGWTAAMDDQVAIKGFTLVGI